MPVAQETSGREDPLLSFCFQLELGGKVKGYFTEVSGIGSENEVVEQKVVNEKGIEVVLKIPGRLKWTEITFKRGITKNMDVWKWRQDVIDGKVSGARTNGSIVMFDRTLSEAARWNIVNAWPSKLTGPAVKADSNEIGIEELVIQHEGIVRANERE
jgi:phage tail-like protein